MRFVLIATIAMVGSLLSWHVLPAVLVTMHSGQFPRATAGPTARKDVLRIIGSGKEATTGAMVAQRKSIRGSKDNAQ